MLSGTSQQKSAIPQSFTHDNMVLVHRGKIEKQVIRSIYEERDRMPRGSRDWIKHEVKSRECFNVMKKLMTKKK